MKKFLTFSTLIVVLLTAVLVPIYAQERVRGTGTLTATGNGRAVARCSSCSVQITGNGTLAILDTGDDTVVNVTGGGRRITRQTEWGTAYIYQGFNGTATIEGYFVAVALQGNNINLSANGTGRVTLRGQGSYSTTAGASGAWTESGTTVEVVEG
jgi:hypothetical protein